MTELPREVIDDLLTVYLAGEASEPTRQLVESYARTHPDFAKSLVAPPAKLEMLPPELELQTLRHTQQLLRWRSLLLGVALAATGAPLSVVFRNGELKWWMVRDAPEVSAAFLVLAIALWIIWALVGRRMRASGL